MTIENIQSTGKIVFQNQITGEVIGEINVGYMKGKVILKMVANSETFQCRLNTEQAGAFAQLVRMAANSVEEIEDE